MGQRRRDERVGRAAGRERADLATAEVASTKPAFRHAAGAAGIFAVLAFAALGCGSAGPPGAGSAPVLPERAATTVAPSGTPLLPITEQIAVACRNQQAKVHYPVLCPSALPRASRDPLLAAWPPMPLGVSRDLDALAFGYGVEAGDRLALNRPAHFLHFVVGRATQGVPRNARPARLGGRRGLLAPAEPGGSYLGSPYFANHLRFLWREHGIRYVATLHTFARPGTRRLLGRLVAGLRPADEIQAQPPGQMIGARAARVPAGPASVALSGDSAWVASRGDIQNGLFGGLVRIDGEQISARPVRGLGPKRLRVAAGGGAIWATHARPLRGGAIGAPRVARIEPASGRIEAQIRLPSAEGIVGGIAVGAGGVWVSTGSGARRPRRASVWRIDPGRNRVEARIPVSADPVSLAAADDAVWVAGAHTGVVSKIDARTNRVSARVRVGRRPFGVAIGHGAVWVTDVVDGTVSRLDPSAAKVTARIPVGRAPYGIAADARGVWVALLGEGRVLRIDPATNAVERSIPVGGDPLALASDGRRLWVTINSDGVVLRF